jgi:hypothetical protein
VCNLYSSYAAQATMRQAFTVTRDSAGNLPPLPAIFPDQMAPVIRNHDGERELIQMRWGIVNLMDFTSIVPVSGRRGLRTFNSLEASMMHSIAPTCLS